MSIITGILIGIGILYTFIIAFSIICFVLDKEIGRIWYYLTCYSFGALFTIRILSLISVTSGSINMYGFQVPVTESFRNTGVFEILNNICGSDSTTLMTMFYINVVLYLIVLFILKMTTNMNTFKIKSIFYCFLLLILASKTTKVWVSYEAYITLFVIAIVLYLFAFFGKNIFKNLKKSLKESATKANSNIKRSLNEARSVSKNNINKNSRQATLNGETYEEENANGDFK